MNEDRKARARAVASELLRDTAKQPLAKAYEQILAAVRDLTDEVPELIESNAHGRRIYWPRPRVDSPRLF